MKNRYESFDELKKRQREQQKELKEAEDEMRKRIDEQKERLAQEQKVDGMSKEEQAEMLKRLENQLEALEHGRLAEQQRQKLSLQQKLAARRAKNAKNKKGKAKEEAKKKEEEQKAKEQTLEDGLKGMFGRAATLVLGDHEDDDSELIKRLRSWKDAKKVADEKKFMEQLASSEVNLGENEIKILVLKLMQVEKLLREVRKKKKRQAIKADDHGFGRDITRNGSRTSKAGFGSRNATRVGTMRSGAGDNSLSRRQSARPDNVRSSLDKNSSQY